MPARFGKYTLLRRLAKGGMAELFLAIQKSVAGFEKLLVIKRILPQMNQDRAFIDMLLHEARIAATLSHPNIIQIFDVGQVDGVYFIAMEHAHGEDLRSMVRQMKRKNVAEFPTEHALGIILGVCAGLSYAHERRELDGTELNIVHRDISPQNVIVTFTGDVKVVDFGIAKSSNAKPEEPSKSGMLKGKVPYMSPEQARGEEVDARSDIFSTGVILYELTTGKRLFKTTSEYDTLKMICEEEYPPPSRGARGLSGGARTHRDARAHEGPREALSNRARDAGGSRSVRSRGAHPGQPHRAALVHAVALRGEADGAERSADRGEAACGRHRPAARGERHDARRRTCSGAQCYWRESGACGWSGRCCTE